MPETIPPVVAAADTIDTVSLETESQRLVDSREKIAYASPDSLQEVIESLTNTDAGKSELGIELIFIASKILDIVYPFAWQPDDQIRTPPSGIYPDLFNSIVSGTYPSVNQADASYFTLVIPPMALLYTDSETIEDLSEESLVRALALNPESVLALYLMGFLAERREELPLAEEYYSRALELAMSCYPAHIGKARILLQSGNAEGALSILTPLEKAFPQNVEVLELTAGAELHRGNYETASAKATDALKLDPENLNLLLIRAKVLEIQGNTEQAERFLSLVAEKRPNTRDVLILRSEILLDSGRYAEARESLEYGLKIFPADTVMTEIYGRLLLEIGASEEGRKILEANLAADPKRYSSLELMLNDAVDRGDHENALEYSTRLIAVQEKTEYLVSAYNASAGLTRWDAAHGYAEKLHEYDGEDLEYRSFYARTLVMTGKTEDAAELITETLPLFESVQNSKLESEFYYLYSMTRETTDEELEDLQTALLGDLRNLEALLAISTLYEREGDYRKAFRYLKQASAIAPGDEITERLKTLEGKM